jgi:Fe-S cluster biogenesis protein NfuA
MREGFEDHMEPKSNGERAEAGMVTRTKIRTLAQATPNPLAYKFLVSEDVKVGGKVSFANVDDCAHVPLARRIMELKSVTGLHLFENFVTVMQDGTSPWEELTTAIESILKEEMPEHVPSFPSPEDLRRASLDPALRRIEEILDETIRPALQSDGGDLEVISLEENILRVYFEGACGTCPSSTAGTLHAITSTLQEKFHPALIVEVVNEELGI